MICSHAGTLTQSGSCVRACALVPVSLPVRRTVPRSVPGGPGRAARRRSAQRSGTGTASRADDVPLADLTINEAEFTAVVLELAAWRHWRTYHTWSSMHSAKGFPDLVLLRPPRLIFSELKSEKGRLGEEQAEWLGMLRELSGVEVYVWRPHDMDVIEQTLT